MKSSRLSHYFLLLLALVLVIVSFSLINDLYFTQGRVESSSSMSLLEISYIFSVCMFLGIFLLLRLGVVEFGGESIIVKRHQKTITLSWSDAKKITKIPFCSPPIYRLSFHSKVKPVYFSMQEAYVFIDTPIGSSSWGSSKVVRYVSSRIANASS